MFMLDTNTVSDLMRQHPNVTARLAKIPPSAVCISSITAAELLYGVAKCQSRARDAAVRAFLGLIPVHYWDSEAALWYGELRVTMEKKGKAWEHWINSLLPMR